jgi:hypothetical protein
MKESKALNKITLFGVIIVLSIIIAQYFYNSEPNGFISEEFTLLALANSMVVTLIAGSALLIRLANTGRLNKITLALTMLMVGLLMVSFHLGDWKSGQFALLSIAISFIYIFDILPNHVAPKTILVILKVFFTIVTILPMFIYLAFPTFGDFLVSVDGEFKGFESSRTTYGVAACIAVTIHMIDRQRGWLVCIGLIMVGIFFAQSRAPLIVVTILSFYIILNDVRIKNKVNLLVISFCGFVFMLAAFVYSGERDEIFSEIARFILIENYFEYFLQNMYFGSGGSLVPESIKIDGFEISTSPAHNFILETLVAFGIFVTMTWLLLLWSFWRRLHPMGRVWILFILTYGSFHNGFGLSVLNSQNFILLILAALTSNSFREIKELHTNKMQLYKNDRVIVNC